MSTDKRDAITLIHEALHQPNCREIRVGKHILPIRQHRQTKARYVEFGDVIVIEQKKEARTSYGQRALQGECLSWQIPKDRSQHWKLIETRNIG